MDPEIKRYEECLKECKRRTDVLELFISSQRTTGFLTTDVEFISLQFRKVLEMIVLSSLVANKEEYAKQREKFMRDWNPNLIMKDLERINPHYYPEPVEQVEEIAKDGSKLLAFKPVTKSYLTKEDLQKLYEQCGGLLHARNPYQPIKDLNKYKNGFVEWLNKIKTLLNRHTIVLFGQKLMVVGVMNVQPEGLPKAYLFGLASDEVHKKLL